MKFTPLRITLIYFAFAVVWITTTDAFIEWLVEDPLLLTTFQTIKGLFYITLTAIGLFFMMKSYERYISKNELELRQKEKSLNLALDSAKMATWEYSEANDSYEVSSNHNQMFGYRLGSKITLGDIYKRIHPDDIDVFKEEADKLLEGEEEFDVKYRVVLPDDKVRWLWTRGEVTKADKGAKKVNGVTIDITENKELEQELDVEKERLEKLFERIPVLINIYDDEQNLISINKYHRDVLGWTESDFEDQSMLELCYPDPEYRQEVIDDIVNMDKGWKEYKVTTKEGDIRHQMWTNVTLSDNTFVGIGYDITDQKELEGQIKKEREELQVIFDNMPVFINLHDRNADIGTVNKFFAERFGYSDQNVSGESILRLITQEKDFELAKKQIQKSDGSWVDFDLVTRDGDIVPTTWINVTISENKSIGIGFDITERKRMEEELRQNEDRLQLTTTSAGIGLWEWHPQTGVTKFDEIWANLVGYSLEELEPVSIETWNELLHPDDHEIFERAVEDYFKGDTPIYECEIRMRHKDGHWVWILDRGRTVEWDEEGNPKRLVGTHIDITERVKYEKENQLLANVFRKSNTALAVCGNQSNMIKRVNHAFCDLFGFRESELVGYSVKNLYQESGSDNFQAYLNDLEENGSVSFETSLKRKDGSVFHGLINMSLVRDKGLSEPYRVTTVQDISELKRIQNQLAGERQRFEVAANNVSDVVWEWNAQNDEVWWGEGLEAVMGYSREEFENSDRFWESHIHEEDRKRTVESLRNAVKEKRNEWEAEYRFYAADGRVRSVTDSAVLLHDENGEVLRIIGAMVDVTLVQEYQEVLKAERNRFELIARSSNDVLYDHNFETGEVWWSEGWVLRFGHDKESVEGSINWWRSIIHPDDAEFIRQSANEALESGDEFWVGNYRVLDGNGEYRIVSDKGYFIRSDDNKTVHLVGTISDITADEVAKRELEKSEEQYRLLFENSPLPMWIYDPESLFIVSVNQAAIRKYGFSREEFKNLKLYELHREEELEEIKTEIQKSIQKKSTGFDTWVQVTKSGEELVVDLSGSEIFYEDKIHRLVIANDITEKKKAEVQLKQSEEQYRLLFEQNPIPMWIYDPDSYRFTEVNQAAIEKYGYSQEEFHELTILDIHPGEDKKNVKTEVDQNRGRGPSFFKEWTHFIKNGDKLKVMVSASDIYYQGKDQRLVIVNDITEQRKAEERAISAIIEGEERERQRVAKELHDGLGQYLSAANMNLKSVYEDAEGLSKKLSDTFENGLQLLNYAISETRNISQNLLPKAIQDYGLELAIESLVNQLKKSTGITFYLYSNLDGLELPENLQINLYRITQEALSNAIRHGTPKTINVQLIYSMDEILLTIEDDGIGFNVKDKEGKGLGLRSMKTRVGAMSANLDIISTLGRGTIISVVVPINPD
ncbi:PAS domain S-box protein [Rhodohalobacter halophilus]|uniref:PAS domain S-box protein n=1 Tax=Rhodohalobacter halophilus TaxID=1812810 RepID=UPI00083F6569|nr:PAS domain S-box protein [Rhodohalobacter halophilus]